MANRFGNEYRPPHGGDSVFPPQRVDQQPAVQTPFGPTPSQVSPPSPLLPNTRPMKSPFKISETSQPWDWRTPTPTESAEKSKTPNKHLNRKVGESPNDGDDYSKDFPNGRKAQKGVPRPKDDGYDYRPPAGGSKVPSKPKSPAPKGSGGVARKVPTEFTQEKPWNISKVGVS